MRPSSTSSDAVPSGVRRAGLALGVSLLCALSIAAQDPSPPRASKSRLPDRPIPLQVDAVPDRTGPLLEIGDPFLASGPLSRGFELPGGAVWQPGLQVFGTLRSALQGFYDGATFTSEWAHRLDLFANLQLSATERIVLGLRPLDDEGRRFTSWQISPESDNGWRSEFDARIDRLFFEGDLGELFPHLDADDSGAIDYGIAVGRQPLRIQDGILIDDRIDALGIVRNNLTWWGTSNLRITGVVGWNHIDRDGGVRDNDAVLLGLFTQADVGASTVAIDVAGVIAPDDTGDSIHAGGSAVQRIGSLNTTLRINTSLPTAGETRAVRRGTLLTVEASRTLTGSDDLVYSNAYLGVDDFSSAARAPDRGGPLANTGILYAAQGIGRYGSALPGDARRSLGMAFGWQGFFDERRRQLVIELGGRAPTDGSDTAAAALGSRFQQAFGQRTLLQIDAFGALQEARDAGFGTRLELLVKF